MVGTDKDRTGAGRTGCGAVAVSALPSAPVFASGIGPVDAFLADLGFRPDAIVRIGDKWLSIEAKFPARAVRRHRRLRSDLHYSASASGLVGNLRWRRFLGPRGAAVAAARAGVDFARAVMKRAIQWLGSVLFGYIHATGDDFVP